MRVALVVDVEFVLPQVVGFAATRIGRRASAAIWALAAAGTTALLGGISAAYRNQEPDLTPISPGSFQIGIAAISVLHFVVGSILGVLVRPACSGGEVIPLRDTEISLVGP
jgi:hypothetical protein